MRTFCRFIAISALCLTSASSFAEDKVQRVRTPYLEGWGQVPLEVLARQAAAFPDTYYLEGPGNTKRIAFTFDDGPSENTSELLDVLKKNQIKATFFWLGNQVERFPELVRQAMAEGHTIANHSYSHPYSSKLSIDAFWADQVGKTQAIYQSKFGFQPTLFRPPYGDITDAEVALLRDKGMKVILWSVDTTDWYFARDFTGTKEISERLARFSHPEGIVLMHDGGGPRGKTIKAVDALIQQLKAQGYEFVTVDQLLSVPAKLPVVNEVTAK